MADAPSTQALDRKDRVLLLTPGRAESHEFEYKRNGTLILFAALNTATGKVPGMTAPRHTSEQFVGFPGDVIASQPKGREIHGICDNLSSRKTELVQAFMVEHANVQVHAERNTGTGEEEIADSEGQACLA